MTNFLKSRVMYATAFYVMFSTLLYTATPAVFLREDGAYKRHGLEAGETLFPISLACYAAAITSFLIFTLIDVTFD